MCKCVCVKSCVKRPVRRVFSPVSGWEKIVCLILCANRLGHQSQPSAISPTRATQKVVLQHVCVCTLRVCVCEKIGVAKLCLGESCM